MGLESLLDIAFERGCGVSRQRALRSAQYRDLIANVPPVTHVTPEEVAEVHYLGRVLADTAFAKLPFRLRQDAKRWCDMSDLERTEALQRLYETLQSKRWKKTRGINEDSVRGETHIATALPHEYGSWGRGRYLPNCLGLSQMLIGYARATGARYFLADVVLQFEEASELNSYLTLRSARELFERDARSSASVRRFSDKLDAYSRPYLGSLVQHEPRRQAHHALLIEVGETWLFVDPYVRRFTTYDARLSKKISRHFDDIQGKPRRGLTLSINDEEWLQRQLVEALKHCRKALRSKRWPRRKEPFYGLCVKTTHHALWLKNHTAEKSTFKMFEKTLSDSVYIACLTHAEDRRWQKEGKEPHISVVKERFRRTDHSKFLRDRAVVRLMYHLVRLFLLAQYDRSQDRTLGHRLVQAHQAEYHLAIMTLNHIAGHTRQSNLELLRFDASQWIIHDTLGEVVSNQETRYRVIHARNIRMLADLGRKHLMPELWHLLPNREEVTHGKVSHS